MVIYYEDISKFIYIKHKVLVYFEKNLSCRHFHFRVSIL